MRFFACCCRYGIRSNFEIRQRVDQERLNRNKGTELFGAQDIIGPTFGTFALESNFVFAEALDQIITAASKQSLLGAFAALQRQEISNGDRIGRSNAVVRDAVVQNGTLHTRSGPKSVCRTE